MRKGDYGFNYTGSLDPDNVRRAMNDYAPDGIYRVSKDSDKENEGMEVPYDQIIPTIEEKRWERLKGTIKGPYGEITKWKLK